MLNSGITWSGWDTNFLAGDGREAHREPRVLAQLGVVSAARYEDFSDHVITSLQIRSRASA